MNRLTGPIPTELGHLSSIHTLNFSHNHLTGQIPTTFSNLKEIQSLDLSHNRLTGEIPPELIRLNFLSVLSVAYNNLSGRIPDRKAQFATFDATSYEGNPLLRGPPLEKGGTRAGEMPSAQPPTHFEENDPFKDSFWWSFIGSYIGAFIGLISFLYIFYTLPGVHDCGTRSLSPARVAVLGGIWWSMTAAAIASGYSCMQLKQPTSAGVAGQPPFPVATDPPAV
ncbi:hypothetical protein Pfo_000546 [Paulownia fortunei]|nr:hypothetical protein Pfo_000546 [Paulownia fortunei]